MTALDKTHVGIPITWACKAFPGPARSKMLHTTAFPSFMPPLPHGPPCHWPTLWGPLCLRFLQPGCPSPCSSNGLHHVLILVSLLSVSSSESLPAHLKEQPLLSLFPALGESVLSFGTCLPPNILTLYYGLNVYFFIVCVPSLECQL